MHVDGSPADGRERGLAVRFGREGSARGLDRLLGQSVIAGRMSDDPLEESKLARTFLEAEPMQVRAASPDIDVKLRHSDAIEGRHARSRLRDQRDTGAEQLLSGPLPRRLVGAAIGVAHDARDRRSVREMRVRVRGAPVILADDPRRRLPAVPVIGEQAGQVPISRREQPLPRLIHGLALLQAPLAEMEEGEGA